MSEAAEHTGNARELALPRVQALQSVEKRDLVLFAAATLAAWAHTIDEIRIGELIAVPFGIANATLVAAWARLRPGWRALASIAFGLLWGLAVIPYHIVPLLEGSVTGQHVSGVSRLVAGAAMVALGVAIACRRDEASGAPPDARELH
jgi:hypothetical protein